MSADTAAASSRSFHHSRRRLSLARLAKFWAVYRDARRLGFGFFKAWRAARTSS